MKKITITIRRLTTNKYLLPLFIIILLFCACTPPAHVRDSGQNYDDNAYDDYSDESGGSSSSERGKWTIEDIEALMDEPATTAAPMPKAPKQSVTVYMVGKEPPALNGAQKVLGAELAKALTQSGSYSAVDRSQQTIEQIAVEQIYQRSGAVDDEQIKKLGMQIGVSFLCVAEISEVMKSYFLEARLVNVETGELSSVASMHGNMTNADDVIRISQAVARQLVPDMGSEIESVFKKKKIADYTYNEIKANPDMAIADYTEAIRQESNVAEYYEMRGYAYLCKEDYDIAIADYSDAIRLNPKEPFYYFAPVAMRIIIKATMTEPLRTMAKPFG